MQLTIPLPACQEAVRFPAGLFNWSEDELFHFCQANRDLRIERSAQGEIVVMSPAGGYSGFHNAKVVSQFGRLGYQGWKRYGL
jgi:Uma2 family endonuclease